MHEGGPKGLSPLGLRRIPTCVLQTCSLALQRRPASSTKQPSRRAKTRPASQVVLPLLLAPLAVADINCKGGVRPQSVRASSPLPQESYALYSFFYILPTAAKARLCCLASRLCLSYREAIGKRERGRGSKAVKGNGPKPKARKSDVKESKRRRRKEEKSQRKEGRQNLRTRAASKPLLQRPIDNPIERGN